MKRTADARVLPGRIRSIGITHQVTLPLKKSTINPVDESFLSPNHIHIPVIFNKSVILLLLPPLLQSDFNSFDKTLALKQLTKRSKPARQVRSYVALEHAFASIIGWLDYLWSTRPLASLISRLIRSPPSSNTPAKRKSHRKFQ